MGRRISKRTFIYWQEFRTLRLTSYPTRDEMMLGKLAAVLKAVNGVENEGALGELIGYERPPSPQESQEDLDKAFFGFFETLAKRKG